MTDATRSSPVTTADVAKQRDDLLAALMHVRAIIVDGAMTGFNCHDGDWADRLFVSQGMTFNAVKNAGGNPRTPIANAPTGDSQ